MSERSGAAVFGVAGLAERPAVVAQLEAAARSPVHAYLFVGPPGAGSGAAALAFSAALLCPFGGCGRCRDCRLVLAGEHPDAVTFVPRGAFLSIREDVPEIVRLAVRSPVEGRRKVLVLTELHRVQEAGPALLKTIEEPPESTVFVVLADAVPPELVTIASRCVRIDMPALSANAVRAALLADGVDEEVAAAVAPSALGDLVRARLLVTDAGLARRQRVWKEIPVRIDGTGATVVVLAAELLGLIEEAAGPLHQRQAEEVAALDVRIVEYGERGSGRGRLEAQHKRELRRHRAAELRFGLATLAATYRDALVVGPAGPHDGAVVAAVDAITVASENLTRNPNEPLLLQALLLRLPPLPDRGRLVPSTPTPG